MAKWRDDNVLACHERMRVSREISGRIRKIFEGNGLLVEGAPIRSGNRRIETSYNVYFAAPAYQTVAAKARAQAHEWLCLGSVWRSVQSRAHGLNLPFSS